jgi:hypothetical protein
MIEWLVLLLRIQKFLVLVLVAISRSILQSIKSDAGILPKYNEQPCSPLHQTLQKIVSKRWKVTPFLRGWSLY